MAMNSNMNIAERLTIGHTRTLMQRANTFTTGGVSMAENECFYNRVKSND